MAIEDFLPQEGPRNLPVLYTGAGRNLPAVLNDPSLWTRAAAAAAPALTRAEEVVADVTKGTIKSRLKKLPKGKLALGAAGLGLLGTLLAGTRKPAAVATPYDPSKINYPGTGTTADNAAQRAALDEYLRRSAEVINQSYANVPQLNLPGAAAYNPLSGMTNQMGGATLAEMQSLAQRAAADAAAIRAGGQTGAASINEVYGGGAAELANLAAAPTGEYGSLTPVSGAAAAAPAELAASGAALSDYLRQNQLVSAQDQGFLSELSGILGPAYATQFAMRDTAARAAADARRQELMAQEAMQRQQNQREALSELGLTGAQLQYQLEAERLKQQQERPGLIDPLYVEQAAAEFQQFTPQQLANLRSQGIDTIEEYIGQRLEQLAGQ